MSAKRNLRKTGGEYEKIAGAYLEKMGYQILEYNFRCRYAEIDIVAKDGDVLVFCEVKYRSGKDADTSLEAVDFRKQKKISRAALYYLFRYGSEEVQCRFDVIGSTDQKITLIKNAFDYTGVCE